MGGCLAERTAVCLDLMKVESLALMWVEWMALTLAVRSD